MPMDIKEHENLINELNNTELTHERRSEILSALRQDYGTVVEEHTELSTTTSKLKQEKEDLLLTNSKLFRQLGQQENPDLQKEQEEQSFSETVTISDLEK